MQWPRCLTPGCERSADVHSQQRKPMVVLGYRLATLSRTLMLWLHLGGRTPRRIEPTVWAKAFLERGSVR